MLVSLVSFASLLSYALKVNSEPTYLECMIHSCIDGFHLYSNLQFIMHVGDWGQHACLQSNYALTHFTSPCSTLLASFVTSLRRPCFGLCLCFCVLPVFVFLCSPCVCVIGFEHKTVYPLWESKNWVPLTCDPLLQNWGKEWEERRRKKWQEVQVGASLGDVEWKKRETSEKKRGKWEKIYKWGLVWDVGRSSAGGSCSCPN